MPWLIKDISQPTTAPHDIYIVNRCSSYDFDDDDDDETDSVRESERVIHEFFVNFAMEQWAKRGLSMPQDFMNPFEIYD